MPLYDYKCERCDLEVEAIQTVDATRIMCPKAGCTGCMIRQVGLPSIIKINGFNEGNGYSNEGK